MIPAGTKVFLASHPVDFRKGPDGLAGLIRDAGADPVQRLALCLPREKSRQDQDPLVGRQRGLPFCQKAGKGEVRLAADRAHPSPAQHRATDCTRRRIGLEKGPQSVGAAASVGGLTAPRSCGSGGRISKPFEVKRAVVGS